MQDRILNRENLCKADGWFMHWLFMFPPSRYFQKEGLCTSFPQLDGGVIYTLWSCAPVQTCTSIKMQYYRQQLFTHTIFATSCKLNNCSILINSVPIDRMDQYEAETASKFLSAFSAVILSKCHKSVYMCRNVYSLAFSGWNPFGLAYAVQVVWCHNLARGVCNF